MTLLTRKSISYWIDSTPTTNFSAFIDKLTVDVAIIGAGIVGLTAAMLLKKAGKSVAVLDSKQVATGVSGHTTAKITSLHRLIYTDLIQQFGLEKARIYASSNQTAIEQIARFVKEEQIDCDFSRQNAYTFARNPNDLHKIEAEIEAVLKLGLPVSFVQEVPLPFHTVGAIEFTNQAQFHPRKYLLHLANKIDGQGSYIFEHTKVEDVKEGNPCQVISDRGTIQAEDVIVATNIPILDRGLFFAKTYPMRAYFVSAGISHNLAPKGIFIGIGNDNHSIRTTPYENGLLLLVEGESHKTGVISDTEECYKKLEVYARSNFDIDGIEYRWSTQDMVSLDRVPYVGKLTPISNHTYVATGFSAWGMTNGTMSAMLLSDLILSRPNPWIELYDATRATPFITQESIKQNLDVATHWVGDRFKGLFSNSVADIAREEGKILTIDNEKIGAYRDPQGEVHAVSATCTHLGCTLNWNSAEKTWDCPCHGARFDYDGEVLRGPAIKNLKKKNLFSSFHQI